MTHHVLTAEFLHESNTFKKGLTELHNFEVDALMEGEEALARLSDGNTGLSGFTDVADEAGWDLTHVISAYAVPGSKVSRHAFEHVAGKICAAVEQHKDTLDGILLAMHGAMVTEFCEDGEGELLQRLRDIVGPDMPIATTLDLHCNVTPQMAELANIIVSYKTYPHIDLRERGQQAGRILEAAMAGKSRPKTCRVACPMLDDPNGGRTDVGPIVPLYARALEHETEAGIHCVSINAGFSDADIHDMGPTVLVTYDTMTEGAEARAHTISQQIAGEIWAARDSIANDFLSVEEACAVATSFDTAKGPLVIADYADNPGSGAYGDATNLLAAMLDAGLKNATFAPMIDPDAAAMLCARTVGDTVTLDLGGKNDPAFGGGPLSLTGQIMHISDGWLTGDGPMLGGLRRSFGPTAVLRVDGIDILVTTERDQMLDLQQFKTFGIQPEQKLVVAVKSMQHFRAAFEPIAGKVIVCDSGALSTPQMSRRPYVNVRRPIWPLDAEAQM
ncbi:M81 family metallopeptidase [Pseudosulfitobacter pseudonitzschiae]|uniref:M81 family metallopeptidase n=1 Tax=Pseudosulfitobacter pseudonitzschiae TaxID=1402135 RepID=UPI001AF5A7E5|nr:M81 family metallopeptidase [Pseudosulfitobacter pseudonitzschiae]MBM1814858.1 M81 family metallopeptidase [Pseudosulfitobacter pseudonitzschiae]MBM1831852.1 M81 family metallopeptidase [Pseudosulfitobacter pseudonitzschiae]MBM1836717.1 M81 family metallopeptidase [Pseudosulfitobacter pseudonitzschiae]MBM1841564.1 M81 family metallopeptidase [Pseudosulfitobacter pseudonitzschiae]MBM1846431.1 M81 family metallopeptidase [Pseudosulfitobacter pseudonitzschiae]